MPQRGQRKGGKKIASYAFCTYEERKKIQEMWEAGMSVAAIAQTLGCSPSTIYTELRRGRDGTRIANYRRRYDPDLAQLRITKSLERRGRRTRK